MPALVASRSDQQPGRDAMLKSASAIVAALLLTACTAPHHSHYQPITQVPPVVIDDYFYEHPIVTGKILEDGNNADDGLNRRAPKSVAHEAPVQAAVEERSKVSMSCEQVGDIAFAIMRNRQVEIPMQRMMAIAGDNELARSLVRMAYSQPAYHADVNKQRSSNEFQNMAYMACLDSKEQQAAGKRQ